MPSHLGPNSAALVKQDLLSLGCARGCQRLLALPFFSRKRLSCARHETDTRSAPNLRSLPTAADAEARKLTGAVRLWISFWMLQLVLWLL
ncbi:hypothetical protein NEOLEDRAFT_1135764, partial [Neolentinus lepideus HHB14362 ss-1]